MIVEREKSNVSLGDYLENALNLRNNEIKESKKKITELQKCDESLKSKEKEKDLIPLGNLEKYKTLGKRYCISSYDIIKNTKDCAIEINKLKHKKVKGDGNCLFRSLSYALYYNEDQHVDLRNQVVKFTLNNWSQFKDQLNILHSQFNRLFETKESYKEYMGENGKYGTDFEIAMFSILYETSVVVFFKKK